MADLKSWVIELERENSLQKLDIKKLERDLANPQQSSSQRILENENKELHERLNQVKKERLNESTMWATEK